MVEEVLMWINLVILILIVLGLKLFMPAYLTAKAKNLANKEDISEITELVEDIRKQHNTDIENLKGSIQLKLADQGRKREVYNNFIQSLGVFIGGRTNDEQKQEFLDCYAALWLWSPDEVITVVNQFIDLQIQAAKGLISDQDVLKNSYAACVIALRRDCGVCSELRGSDYRYVFFGV